MPNNFFKLIEKRFEDDEKFQVDKYLEKKEFERFDDIEICQILPGAKLLAIQCDDNINYHGRECYIHCTKLYKYKKYFIEFVYSGEGDDLEVCNISYNYDDGIINFFDECVKVYKSEEFDCALFLANTNDLKYILDVFHKIYPETGLKRFGKYIKNRYKTHESEL